MTTIVLPTFHPGQVAAYNLPGRYKAIRCGRRWGKTQVLSAVAASDAARGFPIGIFAPDYKIVSETYSAIRDILHPIVKTASRIDMVIRTTTGGRVDFWSLDNERAGRSRKYKRALIDEGAFTKPNMMDIWGQSIEPTLLDLNGTAIVASNTNGTKTDNFFWQICNNPKHGFVQYHAPTSDNPYMPAERLAQLKAEKHPLVWQQEYLAEFVDFSADGFFRLAWLLDDEGLPVPMPEKCDGVFAVIDTAVKDGREHDCTAVSYYAINTYYGTPLIVLDWDIVQIEGALLEHWLPSVFARCEELAQITGARNGSMGSWIEDRQSGSILLQQSNHRGWPAQALPEALTAAGKSGRALNVSQHVVQGKVKISRHAYDKTTVLKGASRNHFTTQVTSFVIGKDNGEDDLFDTFTCAVAIALGSGSEGYA